MNSITSFLNSLGRTSRTIVLALAVVFVSAGIAQASSTISTNIQTDGTLSVTGVSTMVNASTTQSATIAGPLWINGNATTTGAGALSLQSTLGVIGLSTLTGGFVSQASSTVVGTFGASSLLLLSGDTVKNASASSTVLSGNLTVGGGPTGSTLTVTNAANSTSTATVGCIVTTATSSATSIRLMFNTQATTTTLNGNVVQGVVLWGYGSSCSN